MKPSKSSWAVLHTLSGTTLLPSMYLYSTDSWDLIVPLYDLQTLWFSRDYATLLWKVDTASENGDYD